MSFKCLEAMSFQTKEVQVKDTRFEGMMKAANRYEVLLKIGSGSLTIGEAAKLLKLCVRQVKRLRKRARDFGLKGLLHQRVHVSVNQISHDETTRIIRLRQETYESFNVLHFQDVLREKYGIKRSYEFLRQLLIKNKLYHSSRKKRIRKKHRKRFEAPSAGILVQRDTSIHMWIPGAAKPWKLILDIDDHSRKIVGSYFSEHDDVLSNMLVAWETISTHGIPVAYYMDNNAIYNPIRRLPKQYDFFRYRNVERDKKETLPQFKRALKEMGIEAIHSTPYEPQGKGKVERIFRFMQDRLVNEMIVAKVKTIEEGNKYLKKWVDWYNHCHVHSITKMIPNERYMKSNSFRKLPKTTKLEEIFCLKYTRKVNADNTIKFEGKTYQIERNEYRISYARAQVEVRIYLNKTLKIIHGNRVIGTYLYKSKNNNRLSPGGDILALELG